jgi:hypothetical protein
MHKARPAWLFAVLVAFAGCAEPTRPEPLTIAGVWTATVRGLSTGKAPMSMTLADDTGGVTGSGLWDDTKLTINGALAGTTVTLIIAAPPGATLGTLNYSGTVDDDGEKMVGALAGKRWSPPLRVEFSRP